jgi:hypothetical protein
MEQLRKIFKRLAKAPEKIVFAIVVMVLIWRVVQIIWVPPPPPPTPHQPTPPPTADPDKLDPGPDQPITRFADVSVGKWDLYQSPGVDTASDDDGSTDADMPDIRLDRIEEKGAVYAWISVDDGTPKPFTKGKYFADRKAVLEEIDMQAGKIVFKWLPTNRKHERTTG